MKYQAINLLEKVYFSQIFSGDSGDNFERERKFDQKNPENLKNPIHSTQTKFFS